DVPALQDPGRDQVGRQAARPGQRRGLWSPRDRPRTPGRAPARRGGLNRPMAVDVIEYERGAEPAHRVDPITARVIAGALDTIVLEVGHKLTRMSYSSIIRESEDFGVALLDARGRQVCECSLSTPLQLGPIPGYMQGIFRLFKERGDSFEEGDVIIHNSPYHGRSEE